MLQAETLSAPSASTAIASARAESIPPDTATVAVVNPVLLHVVAKRHHERVVHFAIALDRRQRHSVAALDAAQVEIDDEQCLGELAADGDELPVRIVDKALAIERNDVLAVVRGAGGVHVDERLAESARCVPG